MSDLGRLREVAEAARVAEVAFPDFERAAGPDEVLALLDRLEAAEAKVRRVEALADEWQREARCLGRSLSELMLRDGARRLRAALRDPQPALYAEGDETNDD